MRQARCRLARENTGEDQTALGARRAAAAAPSRSRSKRECGGDQIEMMSSDAIGTSENPEVPADVMSSAFSSAFRSRLDRYQSR